MHTLSPPQSLCPTARAVLGVLSLSYLWIGPTACDVTALRPVAAPPMSGVFEHLVVGGTEPDGAYVVARREEEGGHWEGVVVTLGDDPKRCSLGEIWSYDTLYQHPAFGSTPARVDKRSARILAMEGEPEDGAGKLLVFDAQCHEILRGPVVKAPDFGWWVWDDQGEIEGATALTVDGTLLWIDPWEGTTRTLGEQVTRFGRLDSSLFWLVEGGVMTVRDHAGNKVASAGTGVTEVAALLYGGEVAYVGDGGLFVLKVDEKASVSIPTAGVPCKPQYLYLEAPTLAYLDDCAAGNLALLDRLTGEKQVYSSSVTKVQEVYMEGGVLQLFFHREPPGGERELWTIPAGTSTPIHVGNSPDPVRSWVGYRKDHGFFVVLDHDGETGTLGTWRPNAGFSPLLEGVSGFQLGWSGSEGGYLTAVAERKGDIGALVGLDLSSSLEASFRVEGVPWTSARYSAQAPVLGYIRDWDPEMGAGTFELWIQPLGQTLLVDEGVSELRELYWPKPGAVYAARTAGKEGLRIGYYDQ